MLVCCCGLCIQESFAAYSLTKKKHWWIMQCSCKLLCKVAVHCTETPPCRIDFTVINDTYIWGVKYEFSCPRSQSLQLIPPPLLCVFPSLYNSKSNTAKQNSKSNTVGVPEVAMHFFHLYIMLSSFCVLYEILFLLCDRIQSYIIYCKWLVLCMLNSLFKLFSFYYM